MPEKSNTFQFEYYLDLVLKRRWLLIIPLCLALVGGLYLSVKLPKLYEASTMILVISQRVPTDFVRPVVSSDIESRISTISQQILSRSNLEKIIEKFGLFSDPKYSGMFVEDMVGNLRNRIKVAVNREGRRQADAFSITFQGPDPETVMSVTNGIAGSFIQENLRVREAQAVGTSDFLAAELETMRRRLEEVEAKLQEYRRQYMGELPEQLDANLRILERLQMQLSEREQSLRDEKARLIVMGSQIESNRRILTESQVAVAPVSEDGGAMNLAQLKAQLAALKSNYTDRHPDVIKLKAKIADLEARQNNGGIQRTGESQANTSADPALRLVSNTINDLMRQRVETRGEIRNIEIDIAKIKRQLTEYQERIERTPKHEQELLSLNRDYENIQESYESLLNRKLEAESSVNMEKKQKGEQFRILDHAALPQKPISPDVRKLFYLSVAAGLGLGAGLIYVLDYLNSSLKQPKDYELELGLAVLATIPKLLSPREINMRRMNGILTAFSLITVVGLAGVFWMLVVNGVDPMLEIAREYTKSINIPFI